MASLDLSVQDPQFCLYSPQGFRSFRVSMATCEESLIHRCTLWKVTRCLISSYELTQLMAGGIQKRAPGSGPPGKVE